MFTCRRLLSAAVCLLCVCAQAGQDDATFSTDVKVVNVLATVRNKQGEIVRGLTKDDFSLTENGHPQTIRYFSRDSDLPLTLGLMVDTSMSQQRVIDAERGATLQFMDQVLRENKDQAFIMQFDTTVNMRQELTSSRRKLDDALAYVDTPSRSELRAQSGGGTLLYDALVTASRDVMSRQHGRKALIVLTDGVDVGSEADVPAAIEAAQRADTLVYSILFSDPRAYGMLFNPNGREPLTRISRETGGGFFEVSKKQSIGGIFDVIQDELRSEYNIGYSSDDPVRISGFRRIGLITKQKGLIVQSRERYWAQR